MVGRCLIGPDGRVLRVNAEWLRLVGLSGEQALGKCLAELLPEEREPLRQATTVRIELARREQRVAGRTTCWEGFLSPVAIDGGVGVLMITRQAPPAIEPPVSRAEPALHVSFARAVSGLPDGAPANRGEAELRESEQARDSELCLRRLFEVNPMGVVCGNPQGAIVEANQAFLGLVGRSREELKAGALHWEALTPPEHLSSDLRALTEVRERGVSSVYEKEFLRRDGQRVPTLVARASFGGAGDLVAFVVDITERRRAEETLRQSDRRKSEFLAILSHELRNPLAPIRNSLQLLEHSPPGSPHALRAIEVVRRQADHLTRLVDDLLDLTRLSHDKIELQRSRIDLCEVVRKTTDDLASVFTRAELDLRVEQGASPVWVNADGSRMTQVLGNLLHNAVKFTPAGGAVVVTVTAQGAEARLSVRDTGDGMEPAALRQMFEPFAQAEQSLGRSKGGLGLGLALVRGLVEMHEGTVEARSDGAGHGTEFVVTLPLVAAREELPVERPRAPQGRAKTILIIEDNDDAAETLAALLDLAGHRAHIARDGRTGIARARELGPDVILCDLGLPDIDGYEVACTLRADRRLNGTRLVALSGYAQPEDRERSHAAGFQEHLAKPPEFQQLIRVIVAGDG